MKRAGRAHISVLQAHAALICVYRLIGLVYVSYRLLQAHRLTGLVYLYVLQAHRLTGLVYVSYRLLLASNIGLL